MIAPTPRAKELGAIPETCEGFPQSPRAFVEMSEGAWTDADGADVLTVTFERNALEVSSICDEEVEAPLLVRGQVTLRTADGEWDETLTMDFNMGVRVFRDHTELNLLAASRVPLKDLQGSFMLPAQAAAKNPQDSMVFVLRRSEGSWSLEQ